MSSLYAQYIQERTDDQIIETEQGFATYRYLNEDEVYIIDIFVLPEFRKSGIASSLADEIVKKAKKDGKNWLIGTVCTNTYGCDDSLRVLLAYGMRLFSATNNIIVMKKDI